MPASRSRTENWRQTLQRVCDRNGGVEIAIPQPGDAAWPNACEISRPDAVSLIWRVRLLAIHDDEILIESPSTIGQRIDLHANVHLIVVFSVGQNRWMFRSQTLGRAHYKINDAHEVTAIRITIPHKVERCQRRQFYRVSTVGLLLPRAEVRPLLSMNAVSSAETAAQTRIEMLREGQIAGFVGMDDDPLLLPEVGPPVNTMLVNFGGGGAGLMVESAGAGVFEQHRLFWVSFHLTPHIPAPLPIACRLAHVRMDSEQRRYLGMSFELDHHPGYKRFVTRTLCRCVNEIQREQLRRLAQYE